MMTCLLDVYAKEGDLDSACKVFGKVPERNLVSLTAVITSLAKSGKIDEARDLFDELVERDVVCWNVMIDGHIQHGRRNEGLVLFNEMLSRNVKPSETTVLSVLSACGQLGALESGKWVLYYLLVGNLVLWNLENGLEDAKLVFDRIQNKDVVAWNSVIVGYAMHGFSEKALELFGDVYFNVMKDEYKIETRIEHYGCIVNLLRHAGYLEKAYELIKEMEMEPYPVLLGTLLRACRLHGNLGLGKEIVEFLVERKLANSGKYVLLSNIYTTSGNWEVVARMRKMMKESGTQEPGCSSIEASNRIHEFLAGDMRNPKRKGNYRMLSEINGWLREHGFMPQIVCCMM
ncbi:Pentatricopeptide repeat [Dillenia turbinata]|uniref:Pentatricopeptide repeat n=1 Tax=Dillenia turbinata TaxID=194707 RepID=A0AAN8Z434_9MAGN